MTEKAGGEKLLYCSFCGKSQHEVRKLIAGPSVFICDECIELCNDIIRDETSNVESVAGAKSDLPTPHEITELLGLHHVVHEAQLQRLGCAEGATGERDLCRLGVADVARFGRDLVDPEREPVPDIRTLQATSAGAVGSGVARTAAGACCSIRSRRRTASPWRRCSRRAGTTPSTRPASRPGTSPATRRCRRHVGRITIRSPIRSTGKCAFQASAQSVSWTTRVASSPIGRRSKARIRRSGRGRSGCRSGS